MNEALKDVLMPLTILGTFSAGIYYFTKVMTDYLLKKKMVDKGYVNEDTQAIFRQERATDNKFSSLKWGLIIFFAGLALILMEYIQVGPESPLPYGLFAVSVSLGFLIYYFFVKKNANG